MIVKAAFVMIRITHSLVFAYFALITIYGNELVIFPDMVVLL